MSRRRRGVSLIELLVALAVVAIGATISGVAFEHLLSRREALRKTTTVQELRMRALTSGRRAVGVIDSSGRLAVALPNGLVVADSSRSPR